MAHPRINFLNIEMSSDFSYEYWIWMEWNSRRQKTNHKFSLTDTKWQRKTHLFCFWHGYNTNDIKVQQKKYWRTLNEVNSMELYCKNLMENIVHWLKGRKIVQQMLFWTRMGRNPATQCLRLLIFFLDNFSPPIVAEERELPAAPLPPPPSAS